VQGLNDDKHTKQLSNFFSVCPLGVATIQPFYQYWQIHHPLIFQRSIPTIVIIATFNSRVSSATSLCFDSKLAILVQSASKRPSAPDLSLDTMPTKTV
jgi:hypothetical protein